jgi:hypothetical protein
MADGMRWVAVDASHGARSHYATIAHTIGGAPLLNGESNPLGFNPITGLRAAMVPGLTLSAASVQDEATGLSYGSRRRWGQRSESRSYSAWSQ